MTNQAWMFVYRPLKSKPHWYAYEPTMRKWVKLQPGEKIEVACPCKDIGEECPYTEKWAKEIPISENPVDAFRDFIPERTVACRLVMSPTFELLWMADASGVIETYALWWAKRLLLKERTRLGKDYEGLCVAIDTHDENRAEKIYFKIVEKYSRIVYPNGVPDTYTEEAAAKVWYPISQKGPVKAARTVTHWFLHRGLELMMGGIMGSEDSLRTEAASVFNKMLLELNPANRKSKERGICK